MPSSAQTLPAGGSRRHFSIRPSWPAIAVLGVALLALGASLVHVQTRPADGHAVFASADPLLEFAAAPVAEAPAPSGVSAVARREAVVPPGPRTRAATAASAAPPSARPDAPPKPPATAVLDEGVPAAAPLAEPASSVASAPFVVTESGVVRAPAPADAPAQRVVCAGCGRVELVTPVENDVAGSLVYLVLVRMDDGSLRRFEHRTAPAVGALVVVDDLSLRRAGGAPTVSAGGDDAPAAAAPGAKVYGTERN